MRRVYLLPLWARVVGGVASSWAFGQTLNLVVRGRWGLG